MSDSALQFKAQTEHQFRVSRFMTPECMAVDYHAQARQLRTRVVGKCLSADSLQLHFDTNSTSSLDLTTDGLHAAVSSPMHVLNLAGKMRPLLTALSASATIRPIVSLSNLTMLDTLRRMMPALKADILLRNGSPIQAFIDDIGLDIEKVSLSLNSDSILTNLALDASMPDINHPGDSTALRLPAVAASVVMAIFSCNTINA